MMEIMKGYKALGKDMKAIYGNGMGYRLNKWYKMRSNISIKQCKRGYHFFNNIRDIFELFYKKDYDIYEVEAKGDIIKDDTKYVCSEIKLIRKLTEKEINKYIEDNLDILVNDEYWTVRREVARQGYGLDILVNDEYWIVRREVAKQRYRLDILVNDKDPDVRYEAVKRLNM